MDEPAERRADAVDEERRRYRRLQLMVSLVSATLEQDHDLTPEEGVRIILQARRAAVALFPGKGGTFDLIYRPRLVRILEERFGVPVPACEVPGADDSGDGV